MRWNFGGNLQPVRIICEYDWKECPIAVISYIWSEIVTDVIDGVTGETQLWRILAVMLLCSMLFHTVYYKMRWLNKSGNGFAKDDLVKVGFKMQDLELKINILTYKMQYGTWPMPHEIPTPSLNELRNVKLTLSNTSRQNMWTKHHLHGYISKFIKENSEDLDSDEQNLLSQFGNRNDHFESLKSKDNLKFLNRETNCNDYVRLVKTAAECRRYMDEINESNKSLGLFDNSSDISDENLLKGTESDKNSHRFLIDQKKWHEIYKCKNRDAEEVSESDLTASNRIFSMSNFEHKDSMFHVNDERYPLKSSNRSRLLPPGLSITFLSDKFKTLSSSDKCVEAEDARKNKTKISTNETLNKVKEKLESLHDINHVMKSSKSLSNVNGNLEGKRSSEIALEIKTSNKNSGIVKSLPKIIKREEYLSNESDSVSSSGIKSTYARNNDLNSHRQLISIEQKPFESNGSVVRSLGNILNDKKIIEKNINLNTTGKKETIPKEIMSYVLSPQYKSNRQKRMETEEDANFISETSSRTELSKDSDTDDKSTTTLLREALEFKKALLIQIHGDNEEMCEGKSSRNESSDCESDDTSRSKTENHFRSKLLDIISEEQSAGSSTERTSRTYILSRAINETNLCDNSNRYFNQNNNIDDLKCNKVIPEVECCGDSKSAVNASSSEYFSTNNVTDNEHASAHKLNQCVADGDGLREVENLCVNQGDSELNVVNNHQDNNNFQVFDLELKNYKIQTDNKFFEEKSEPGNSQKSQDKLKQQEIIKICEENLPKLNKLENIKKIEETIKERCGDSLSEIKEQVDSIADKTATKIASKLNVFQSLSSIDSEKGISWNTISESSSSESISHFVNALSNIESKNIDTITEQKLMMLNSTDYEGRNFATAGEDLGYNFNRRNIKPDCFISLSDQSVSQQGNGIIEEILEMIADSVIFNKLNKPKTKEQNILASNETLRDRFEGSDLFNSKLDQEKLQRKQDIFSKLKTLDAFTKPLDISECNSEKNEYEGEASPLTGRTVVCNSNSKTANITESINNIENELIKDKSNSSCIETLVNLISDVSTNDNKLPEAKSKQLFVEKEINESKNLKKEESGLDTKNKLKSITDENSDSLKCDINLESKKMVSNTKRNQLSKSSITNFSTDTSESYFDVSNHDFAVSSVILTSQNSNFVSNHRDDLTKSDTSSLYVDANDWPKLPSNSSSAEGNPRINLSAKKYYLSESQIVKVNTNDSEEIKATETGIPIKDVKAQNNLDSKHESLTKAQLIPKCTSSLPSNDKKSQLNGQICVEKSSCSLNPSFKLEKSNSKVKSISRSCIPVLKSRIDAPRREKSIEAEARSRSPVRRLNTPRIEVMESNNQTKRTASDVNENTKGMRQKSTHGSRRSLNGKHSYTLPSKSSDNKQECLNEKPDLVENKDCKIEQAISSDSTDTANTVRHSGQLSKECTVIYINIISDSDRNESQSVDAKELIKYVNEKNLISCDKKLDPKCQSLSLRNLKSDQSKEGRYEMNLAGPTSDSKLCKNGNEKAFIVTRTFLEAGRKDSAYTNEFNKNVKPFESVNATANKLLSTSTLELSNNLKAEQREIEVSAKPSVKNTSTSVSDFPKEERFFYNTKNDVFDVSKDFIQKEQIVLSEMLATDQNFFECKKTHRLYNKLGLGIKDQTEEL